MTAVGHAADLALDLGAYVKQGPGDIASLHLMVENLHCAGCIKRIESALLAVPGVVGARVNMSTRRLHVRWRSGQADPALLIGIVTGLGYPAAPFDPGLVAAGSNEEDRRLLRSLAVAGFAAGNVMLLSISVWAGRGADMGEATRTLFLWISALIALPAVAYAGRPFFRSALAALAGGGLNMDVPISLAVILAAGMSLVQTMQGRADAYFEASVTLLFFLLIGRYLDRRARAKARSAAEHLLALSATAATVVDDDGGCRAVPVSAVAKGMTVAVAAGDRIPVDGTVIDGRSEIDTSLVTGETLPKPAAPGERVFAGTLNLAAPLRLRVTAAAEDTLLAEIVRLMEAADQGRARYVRLADRVARLYAPMVHLVAAATFFGWLLIGGVGWEAALTTAIVVLIITCPCALGLAVPAVQVVASGLLLRRGVLVKAGDALERLAAADAVVFDKTGTLTLGRPELIGRAACAEDDLVLAAALARESRHPLSRAIVRAAGDPAAPSASGVTEQPGRGLAGSVAGEEVRLGSRAWCGVADREGAPDGAEDGDAELWLVRPGRKPVRFAFADGLRSDAVRTVAALRRRGLHIELLSGDRDPVVRRVAERLGIARLRAGCLPEEKVARLERLAAEGRRVLMVGDGLNDAPALAAGFVSMSPASAADVSQTAADFVFQGDRLSPLLRALDIAVAADRLVKQNFVLAFLYNVVAVPVAVAGLASPLIAAVAMSTSSLVVTLNALRLRLQG